MVIDLDADSFAFSQQTNPGITADGAKPHGGASPSSSEVSTAVSSSDDDSDLFGEEVNSSGASGSSTDSLSGQLEAQASSESLQDMSSLLQELPIKRGLSKHYNGKSQSFTSLANVTSLEDLAKPENPYNKKLKSCRSYGGLYLESQPSSPRKLMPKKGSRGSCSSLCVRRNSSFLGNGNKPPIPPPSRSNSSADFGSHKSQSSLFALGV